MVTDGVSSSLLPSTEVVEDYDLWHLWVGGDEAAGAELVQRHFLAVYRFFASKLPDQADDLTQATFVACIEARNRFRADSQFRSFILGIARKQLLRALEGRGQVLRGRATSEVSIADLAPSPSTAAAHAQQRDILLDVMRQIPLDFQIVLELHYWEDLETAAIAEVLDIPPGTVKSRLSRARGHLRDAFAKHGNPDAIEPLAHELRVALERRP